MYWINWQKSHCAIFACVRVTSNHRSQYKLYAFIFVCIPYMYWNTHVILKCGSKQFNRRNTVHEFNFFLPFSFSFHSFNSLLQQIIWFCLSIIHITDLNCVKFYVDLLVFNSSIEISYDVSFHANFDSSKKLYKFWNQHRFNKLITSLLILQFLFQHSKYELLFLFSKKNQQVLQSISKVSKQTSAFYFIYSIWR